MPGWRGRLLLLMGTDFAALVAAHYDDLRAIARREAYRMRHAPDGHAGGTSLLGDAMVRLLRQHAVPANREQLLGVATMMMRRAALNRARAARAARRSAAITVPLGPSDDAAAPVTDRGGIRMDEIRAAIDDLQVQHPRAAEVLALSAVCGLTCERIAHHLRIGTATVERDLRLARSAIARALCQHENSGGAG